MTKDFWTWLLTTDSGLALRAAGGVIIFSLLAWWDIRRKGPEAKRWREYVFLLAATAAGVIYAVLNDQISSALSWEYFYYHDEGTAAAMGDPLPPPPAAVHWAALKLGLRAGWTPGLLIGAALLIANNPSRLRPQLPYPTLARQMLLIAVLAAACSAVGAAAGLWGTIAPLADESLRRELQQGDRFLAAYGMHLGAYAGGAIGSVAAIWRVRRRRRQLPPAGA